MRLRITGSIFVLVVASIVAGQIARADSKPRERAVVAAIDLGTTVPTYLAAKLTAQIEAGLAAAGYDVVPGAKAPPLTDELARCREAACVRSVGKALAVQAVVYAVIAGRDDNIVITMRLFDASTAQQEAEVHEVCELCGEAELSERLDLAASTLRARAVEAREKRATLPVNAPQPLLPARPRSETRRGSRSMVPGLAIGAAGAVVLAGGIYLIAIDGRGMCSPGDHPVYPDPGAVIRFPDSNHDHYLCRDIYKTKSLGIVGAGLGIVGLAAGAVLVIRARDDGRSVELTPLPGGGAVKVSLPW